MTDQDQIGALEVKAAVDELGRAFAAHQEAHQAQEAGADPLIEEKLDRIDRDLSQMRRALDRLSRKAARPALEGAAAGGEEDLAHKSAFYDRYVRRGIEADLAQWEAKSLQAGVAADGGYAIPEQLDQEIDRLLKDASPIRAVAKVVAIGSANYKKLVTVSGAASGWVGETDARPETNSPQFAEITPPLGEIYANPAATQAMLDDSYFDVEAWLAEELAVEFGAKEGAAFVAGDGANKPKGFLTYATAAQADGARAFGTLEHMATGAAGAFAASDPTDILISLAQRLRPAYRQGAAFVMNSNTVALIRKFKDADGNYLWRPGLEAGASASLLGYPVVEAEDMPDVGADALAIAFGNFNRGYMVTDRFGARVLRDPFSNKPFVHFYATKRTGGGVVNSEAIKLLKFAAA